MQVDSPYYWDMGYTANKSSPHIEVKLLFTVINYYTKAFIFKTKQLQLIIMILMHFHFAKIITETFIMGHLMCVIRIIT